MAAATVSGEDRHRMDKWLWHVRLYKTRSLAVDAINGGKVKVAGERVKPAHTVRIGQNVSITLNDRVIEIEVRALPSRRGSASEALASYGETQASAERSTRVREAKRLAALAKPEPDHRPDKRERRALDQLRRRQGS